MEYKVWQDVQASTKGDEIASLREQVAILMNAKIAEPPVRRGLTAEQKQRNRDNLARAREAKKLTIQ